jgi:hypothetical protein
VGSAKVSNVAKMVALVNLISGVVLVADESSLVDDVLPQLCGYFGILDQVTLRHLVVLQLQRLVGLFKHLWIEYAIVITGTLARFAVEILVDIPEVIFQRKYSNAVLEVSVPGHYPRPLRLLDSLLLSIVPFILVFVK